jgi:hypothetical protein
LLVERVVDAVDDEPRLVVRHAPSMSAPGLREMASGLRIAASIARSMSASSETSVRSAGTSTQSSQVTADRGGTSRPHRVELPRDDVDLLRVGEQRRTLAALRP